MKFTLTATKLLLTACLLLIFNKAKSCEDSFTDFESSCYYVGRSYYDWRTCEKKCQEKGSTLVSVHSMDEAKFLERLVKNVGSGWKFENFWIGFSTLDSDGVFKWTDNTTVDFTNFDENEPNNVEKKEDCVTMSKKNGLWNDDDCSKVFSYICKKVKHTQVPTTNQTTEDPGIGNCLKGWIPHRDRCYYISSKEEKKQLSWNEAKDFCDKKGGYLTSVRDSDDQEYLAYLLQIIGEDTWIGFRASSPSYKFVWHDNSDSVYTNWIGHARGFSKNCAKMVYKHVNSGVWMKSSCDRKLGFICYTKKDPNLPPFKSDGDMKCVHPEGWLKLNNMCFQLFEGDPLKRDEAEKSCNKKGAHLVSISDPSVKAVVYHLTRHLSDPFYIGLKYDKESQSFKWRNNFPVTVSNWDKDEPGFMTENTCYASTPEGYWQEVDCDTQLPYLCQKTKGKPKRNKYEGQCPSSSLTWVPGNHDYCYMVEKREKNYFQAWSDCRSLGSHVFSLHSMEEIEDVRNIINADYSTSLYIGLERNKNGGFRWSDDSPVNFENWDEDEPGTHFDKDSCVAMSTHNMKWSVVRCQSSRRFICLRLKSNLVVEEIETVSEFPVGLSTKPVVPAAILGSLLAVGLIGFLYYIMKIRKRSGSGDESDTKKDRPEMTEKMSMRGIVKQTYD